MTTASQARSAVRSRIEGASLVDSRSNPLALRWQNQTEDSLGNVTVPEWPAPFAYFEFLTEKAELVSFGGGAGSNRYRNNARLIAYVFVPKGEGLDQAETIAESIAARLRSYRDNDISCFDATVYPGGDGAELIPRGLASDVGKYFWASCEVSLYFDQIG